MSLRDFIRDISLKSTGHITLVEITNDLHEMFCDFKTQFNRYLLRPSEGSKRTMKMRKV
jgi:hypothetical protein